MGLVNDCVTIFGVVIFNSLVPMPMFISLNTF